MFQQALDDDACRRQFERLGLLPGASARELRRAYARELNKIDQAEDIAGFQLLHACYEQALKWTPAPSGDPAVSTDVIAVMPGAACNANGDLLADAMFAAFQASLAAHIAAGNSSSDIPYLRELQRVLAHDRMMHLAARERFEQHVACLLARGWQRGHEMLLGAAVDVFSWGDRQTLLRLGDVGIVLDQALTESAMFDSQPPLAQMAQHCVLQQLRRPQPAMMDQILKDIVHLECLVARFPHWLRLMAPRESIAWWLQCCPPLPEGAIRTVPLPAPSPTENWMRERVISLVLMTCLMIYCKARAEPVTPSSQAELAMPSIVRLPLPPQQTKQG